MAKKSDAKAAALEAKQAKRAEKARKKASNDPKDMGRIKQIVQAFKVTHEYDRPLPWIMLAALLVPIAVFVTIGFLTGHPVYLGLLGFTTGLLVAMIVLVQRAKKATYKRYAGQAGSAEVALSMLPKKWISKPVITATRQMDAVHRTLGPGGLILIGEGDAGRLRAVLASEVKKHERVAYGLKVVTVQMGDGKNQVPLAKLADHIKKLPKTLENAQITDIKARLRALDAVRPQMPVPKGPVPQGAKMPKGARQAMRGR
ncbi:MAG: DUF4191 domain-containing protein [Propionibacteriaceae bacterium]